jgi:hypothetical protein
LTNGSCFDAAVFSFFSDSWQVKQSVSPAFSSPFLLSAVCVAWQEMHSPFSTGACTNGLISSLAMPEWQFVQSVAPTRATTCSPRPACGVWQDMQSPFFAGSCTHVPCWYFSGKSPWQVEQSAKPCAVSVAGEFGAVAAAWHEVQSASTNGLWP